MKRTGDIVAFTFDPRLTFCIPSSHPEMTSPLPTVNSNSRPLSYDESTFFPSSKVKV